MPGFIHKGPARFEDKQWQVIGTKFGIEYSRCYFFSEIFKRWVGIMSRQVSAFQCIF